MAYKVRVTRFLIIGGVVLYVLGLSYTYSELTARVWTGYPNFNPPLLAMLVSSILAAIPSVWMPVYLRRPTQLIFWCLYIMVYIPTIIVAIFAFPEALHVYLCIQLPMFLMFCLFSLPYWFPLVRIPSIFSKNFTRRAILVFVFVLLYLTVAPILELEMNIIRFSEVYDVRAIYKTRLAQTIGIIGILIRWIMYVLNPLLFGYGITRKKWWMIILGLLGQIIIYSTTGFKSSLFVLLLVPAVLIAYRQRGRLFGVYIVIGSVGIIVISRLLDIILDTDLITSLFVRRAIIVPGLLTNYYFDFFLTNPKVLLSNSTYFGFIFRLLGYSYPYSDGIPYVIGEAYFGRNGMSANANIWADAFANFGYPGLFIYTLVLALLFNIYDSIAARKDPRIALILLTGLAVAFTNSALLTVLIGHGFLIALIILCILPSDISQSGTRRRAGFGAKRKRSE